MGALALPRSAAAGWQRFLATGSQPRFPIGGTYDVSIRRDGDAFAVTVDGTVLARIADRQSPYQSGTFGLYCEDSMVRFGTLRVQAQ